MSEAQVEYEKSIDDDAIRADEAQRGIVFGCLSLFVIDKRNATMRSV